MSLCVCVYIYIFLNIFCIETLKARVTKKENSNTTQFYHNRWFRLFCTSVPQKF